MTPQWEKRLKREVVILVACLVYGLVLPLALIPLCLLPLYWGSSDSPDKQLIYFEFLHALVTLCIRPLSNQLGWALFLAPYPVFQLGRSILWAIKASRARSGRRDGPARREQCQAPRI